jgi:hypothetical protein
MGEYYKLDGTLTFTTLLSLAMAFCGQVRLCF